MKRFAIHCIGASFRKYVFDFSRKKESNPAIVEYISNCYIEVVITSLRVQITFMRKVKGVFPQFSLESHNTT